MTPADTCRANGWTVGTRLVGDEYGQLVIEITAIGETCILAKPISYDGQPLDGDEGTWVLDQREWRVAK